MEKTGARASLSRYWNNYQKINTVVRKSIIMTIQLNSDNNLTIHEVFRDELSSLLRIQLSRFSEQITRLEVHLSDERGQKKGVNDKRCLLEARLEGMKPIAVTNRAGNYEQAVEGAAHKLRASLDTILGRLSNHHQPNKNGIL